VDPSSLDAIFLSHEHADHARGAAAFAEKWGVPLAGTRGTYAAARLREARLPAYETIAPGKARAYGRLTVSAVAVPHDAAGPVAFVVSAGGAAFFHATDVGHVHRGLIEALRGCSVLLVESNYDPSMLRDGPYPWGLKERILGPLGHLSNGDVAQLLERGLDPACQRVVLAHLSRTNNHPELALMAATQALERGGRRHVRVSLAAPEGTDWIVVAAADGAAARDPQMRLF
jgi:phosphoribosyl 1,2-cyclic phosphodiesterase